MIKNISLKELEKKAKWVWEETLKIHYDAPETRVASSLSPIEILVAIYYGGFLNIFPKNPLHKDRDRLIISKGHGSLCMYPILADLGFFSKRELKSICKEGSFLGGIPDPVIPGYETINGSLGHGVGVGSGMALALKKDGKSKSLVFVLTGDGELHEGSNWEAFMFAAQHKLDNLTILVDDNKISMLGHTKNIVSHLSLSEKLKSFGWHVSVVDDGHNISQVVSTLTKSNKMKKKPKAIIFNTNKGNQVPGLENTTLAHVTAIKPDLIKNLIK